ncbi:MAG: bifunctional response regulator/alkaline phosphatase family protein [Bacteroidales bacterium]|nr:bifunctional response regulator/alkaline phosphatase family protein [Bacteroidales bacterium]MDD6141657.1 bifunctional response regulator/alkaline phosphatase family protein [Bacteroidales bacterium]MDD6622288.1 bifunctional response regulator/alkaline phosphatase family protein [Bacteroidales bacterium]MDD6669984.1 bifunctional response regulator/alkaline phosphatase family protein [Bacteroidales bacterium]
MERNGIILWADDEIDLLKPHIMFLKAKGYDVTTVNNGADALDSVSQNHYDLVILDENMPGLSGLETLSQIKQMRPDVPVIMITKSEEENIMNQAIGNKIADYLIKPVNPNQILMSLKKNLHSSTLVSQKATSDYQQEFRHITEQINDSSDITDWYNLYRKLVFWEMELAQTDTNMDELLLSQKSDANAQFCKYIKRNYESWIDSDSRPLMSNDVFRRKVFPLLDAGEKVFFVLIDNFRLDQWRIIKPLLAEYFSMEEDLYCSILPTATQYARNAIFSGLMPVQIEKMFPELWVDEDSEEGKNINESPLIQTQLDRFRKKYTFSYNKVYEGQFGDKLLQNFRNFERYDLNVIVFNFIDMLSHARTESKMIRELASTDAAYRSLTESWFRHSSASDLLRRIAESGYRVVLTTDHGTIRSDNPIKVVGDKNTNTNLRYKLGKNLTYNEKQVYAVKSPARLGLPSPNISTHYIFATNNDFFAYPNNYNHYVQYYKGTFQHGGISMEEMLIPLITMQPK